MSRRAVAATSGLLGALLLGGVSQAYFWRWGLDGLAGVTSSQFMWVLLTFGVAWGWALGRVGQGVAAGALTGAGLIASYYALQWLADGRHAAVAQFAKTGGPAWSLAAVGGGALMGLLGAFAGMPAQERPRLVALGMITPAVVVTLGPSLWLATYGASLNPASRLPAVALFGMVGAALIVAAVRRCGPRAAVQALGLALLAGGAVLAVLLVLQTSGWLYLTF